MPTYAESPFERIVSVHWKHIPPEPPDPGQVDGVCGEVRLVGGAWASLGGAGIIVQKQDGVWAVAREYRPGASPDKPYILVNALDAYDYDPLNTLVWNTATSFTVAFTGTSESGGGAPVLFRLQEYRNLNIQRFAGMGQSEWSTYPPAQQITLPGSITIEPQKAGEIYPPFYTLEYSFYQFWVRHNYPGGRIQAHCTHETTGALPPQPPPEDHYHIEIIQSLPGSTSDPVIPPPGATLSTRGRIKQWT